MILTIVTTLLIISQSLPAIDARLDGSNLKQDVIHFLRVVEANSAATVQNVVRGCSKIAKRDIDLFSGVVQDRDVDFVLSEKALCFSERRFVNDEVYRNTLTA